MIKYPSGILAALACGAILGGIALTGCAGDGAAPAEPVQAAEPKEFQPEQTLEIQETEPEQEEAIQEAPLGEVSPVSAEKEAAAPSASSFPDQLFSLKKENVPFIKLFADGLIDYSAVCTVTDPADKERIIAAINALADGIPAGHLNPVTGGLPGKIEITLKDGTVFSYAPDSSREDMTLYCSSSSGERMDFTYSRNGEELIQLMEELMNKYPAIPPALTITDGKTASMNLYNKTEAAYTQTSASQRASILRGLAQVKWTGTGTQAQAGKPLDSFMVLYTQDQTRHEYYLYENAVLLAGTAQDFGDLPANVYYLAEPESLKAFASALSSAYQGQGHGAQWLGYMNANRIGSIQIKEGGNTFQSTDMDSIHLLSNALKAVIIKDGSASRLTVQESAKQIAGACYQASLMFDSGIIYSLGISEDSLIISSSDMEEAYRYEIAADSSRANLINALDSLLSQSAAKNNPSTAKPVIYLYPEQEQEVRVAVNFRGNLTYTYPAMASCWKVLAQPDGTLTNLADSSTHYYLFWEGNSNTQWDFSQGFAVKGSDTQAFLTDALAKLGLTPREYNDFLVYWVPEMQQNPYNLITFSTQQYEELAPLTVSPAPDTVIRVHMVYKPLDKPVDIPPQKLEAIPRRGFTLVEWGGSRAEKEASLTQ